MHRLLGKFMATKPFSDLAIRFSNAVLICNAFSLLISMYGSHSQGENRWLHSRSSVEMLSIFRVDGQINVSAGEGLSGSESGVYNVLTSCGSKVITMMMLCSDILESL